VFFGFPIIIRWFFKRFTDSVSQYIFVLAMVFLAAFLAEAAGVEAIIGAFFAGLVLNQFVPHSSPLMNRIDFVGNALFIPFFLIGVGMLVDVSVLVKGTGALKVAGVIVFVAIVTKYIAAKITQKAFRLSPTEGNLIFGLSSSHAAATLAIILVGYNIIIGETPNGDPIRLLDEDVLNGTIILILVSCAVSSFQVERSARTLALAEESAADPTETDEKILVSLAYPDMVTDMVELGLLLRPRKSPVPVYALHIVSDDEEDAQEAAGKKMLKQAQRQAAATENTLLPLIRYDASSSNGIIYSIKEQKITSVLLGLHRSFSAQDFLGPVAEKVLANTTEELLVYQPRQPLNTLARLVAVVPPHAELEVGFGHWLSTIRTLAQGAGLPLVWYAHPATLAVIKEQNQAATAAPNVLYQAFENWDDFLIFSKEIKPNDLFVIVSSRPAHASYLRQLTRLPHYLARYFTENSFLLLFPHQVLGEGNGTVVPVATPGELNGVKDYFKGLLGRRK
ncbi:MAG: cation:proton antiporter, partial [Hymenobacter sp.]